MRVHLGIIPAYAGSTATSRTSAIRHPDHPRIRGEHADEDAVVVDEARIIPAYAGSTFGTHRVPIDVRDHPRIRGEHPSLKPGVSNGEGSSPHTRGAHENFLAPSGGERIIPAYAGSTAPA